jgi:hypothetical protein
VASSSLRGIVPGWHRVGGRTPFEGVTVLLRGVRCGESMGVGSTVCGMTLAIPYNNGTTPGMAAQRRVGRTTPGSNSQV